MSKTILCHCEDIELEELFSALSQGFCDIESLKRYTGIGTGKCQGKCCIVQTLRVLSSEPGLGAAAAGQQAGPGEPVAPQSEADLLATVHVPTIRQPVTPVRIDDIIEQGPPRGDSE